MAQQFAVPSDRRAPLLVRCYYFRADPRFGAVRDPAVAHCSYGGGAALLVDRAGVPVLRRRRGRQGKAGSPCSNSKKARRRAQARPVLVTNHTTEAAADAPLRLLALGALGPHGARGQASKSGRRGARGREL